MKLLHLGLSLAMLLGSSVAPTQGATRKHTVRAGGFEPVWTWEPQDLTISVGDKVVWKNPTGEEHHVLPYGDAWAGEGWHLEPNGGKGSRVFRKPGEYDYLCEYHAQIVGGICLGQCGTITVE